MKNFAAVDKATPLPNHTAIIENALKQGLALFDQAAKKAAANSTKNFLAPFMAFQLEARGDKFFDDPEAFHTAQTKLFEIIYDSTNDYSLEQKLFFEFLLGLCRFNLSLNLYVKFSNFLEAKKIIDPLGIEDSPIDIDEEPNAFWTNLHATAEHTKHYIEALIEATDNFKKIDFWKYSKIFFGDNPKIEKLARCLASMHFIPETAADKRILGLAQILHWGGFGGSGDFLRKYPQIEPLLAHRIGYHAREEGGFNSRFDTIFAALNASKDYANKASTELALATFPAGAEINILDVGSGPDYLAAKDIAEALLAEDRQVTVTASEVDTTGITALLKKISVDGPLSSVRYFDLNYIDEIPEAEIPFGTFDIVTARLVLHQLSEADIAKALEFFVKVLKPGGLIINADVGRDGYHQALLVPANEVDREGGVPGPEEKNLVSVEAGDGQSKIAFPLTDKTHHSPNGDQQLYTCRCYQVLSGSNELVANLNTFWQTNKMDEASRLATQLGMTKT